MSGDEGLVLRDALGMNMTPETALRIGRLLGHSYRTVSCCRDMHPSTSMIDMAFRAGIEAAGGTLMHSGIVPAPAMPFSPVESDCYVTIGTHNPDSMSGIEIHRPDGSFFSEADVYGVTSKEERLLLPTYERIGRSVDVQGTAEAYADRLKSLIGGLDCALALDCSYPCPSLLAAKAANDLGADTLMLSYRVPHGAENILSEPDLRTLQKTVKDTKLCNMGAALSHDGGRIDVFDENGIRIPGSKVPIMIASFYGIRRIAVPLDFTMAADDVVKGVVRTPGNIMAVSDEIREGGAGFGADAVGRVISDDMSLAPDGILALLRLADMASQAKLSDLAAEIPDYQRSEERIKTNADWDVLRIGIEDGVRSLDGDTVSTPDGIRTSFESGWSLIRYDPDDASVVITCEARDKAYLVGINEMTKGVLNLRTDD